jgi:amino acid transporter
VVQPPRPGRGHHGHQASRLSLLALAGTLNASCSFACANFISTASTLGTSYVPSAPRTIGIYAAILFTQGLINTFGVHLLKYLNNVSVWWHAVGTTSLVIAILAKVRCSHGP